MVDKPTTSTLSVTLGAVVGIEDFVDPDGVGLRGATYIDPNNFDPDYHGVTNGILYIGTVNDPVAYSNAYGGDGTWCYAQNVIVGRNRTRLVFGANVGEGLAYNDMAEVLDGGFPYQKSLPANGLEQEDGDGPGEFCQSDYISLNIDESFETCSMYLPPGNGSCYVPLKNFTWYWQGDLNYNSASNLRILFSPGQGYGIGGDFPAFPVWTLNVRDEDNIWQ